MQVETLSTSKIDLHGVLGTFYIEGCDIKVRYFSTYATPSAGAKEGGHYELLKHLSPMRERVDSSKISSLDSLLQRDLSDERIASDLIPYLQGKFSKVGFFPPVLSILMPKGFLGNGEEQEYPNLYEKTPTELLYEDYWEVKRFPGEDGEPTRLGLLSIYTNKVDIIVIDGQHRSNAFRYASGSLEIGDIYRPFYEGVSVHNDYESDLPVTMIWFERTNDKLKVKPTDISRELFVAVNNSAKQVSAARTVLLDEVNVVSLGVNSYYNSLAESCSFSDFSSMNLLSSGFDVDSELSDSHQPKMLLTNPIILKQAIYFSYFGIAVYDLALDRLRDSAKMSGQDNSDRFKYVFGDRDFIDERDSAYKIFGSDNKNKFRKLFVENYLPILDLLYKSNSLSKLQFQSIELLDKWARDVEVAPQGIFPVWTEVFCGGEGLYSAYFESQKNSCKPTISSILTINAKFEEIRMQISKESFGLNNYEGDLQKVLSSIYKTFNTVAFQTGALMTFDYVAKHNECGSLSDVIEVLEPLLSDITLEKWMIFFTEFKTEYIGTNLMPASWPMFKKMLLRLLEPGLNIFENQELNADAYPEYSIAKRKFENIYKSYVVAHRDVMTDKISVEKIGEVMRELNDLYNKLDIEIYKEEIIKENLENLARELKLHYEAEL